MTEVAQPCTVQYIHHVGIAVRNLQTVLDFYQDVFGINPSPIQEAPEHGLRASLIQVGETYLELLEPLGQDSVIGKFIVSHGEGLHHLCFRVENINEKLDILKAKGVQLIDEQPRMGLTGNIAFVHPKAAHGVLIELSQESGV